ncbi:MAG: T9SS type A sorting domain-containing protein, partial [Chitinophagaceae bacterium]|nr:T9SS type A sorting domain-containing protein [Chitinophagaceae bacterium]
TLALIYNATNGVIQTVNIPITAGQKIAILGTAGTVNSYGDPTTVTSSISGHNVTLKRMGYQGNMPSSGIPNYWTEPSGYISRVEMYYETCHTAITSSPNPVTICENQQAKFNASATDVSTYQWQVDEGSGFADISNGANYEGVTTNSLTVKNTPFSFNGNKYRCLAMKSTCIDTSLDAQLTVNGLVHLDPLPVKDTTCVHASKDLEVKGTGSLVSYKWQVYVNGGFIDVPNQYPYVQSGNKLTISDVLDTLDGSQFRCVVTGICDVGTSTNLTLTVNSIPTVAIPPKDVQAKQGENIVFSVQASGKYATYRWQVAGPDTFAFINDGGIYSGVKTNILHVLGVSHVQDGFRFRCIVGTSSGCITAGDTSEFAMLSVAPATSVNSIGGDELMVLYPNPTGSSELYIRLNGAANTANMKYKVIDKTGRTVLVGNIENQGSRTGVDVSRLPAGIYMVELLDEGNQQVARSRFTKL